MTLHGLDSSFLVAVEVTCHADHASARNTAKELSSQGDRFGISPQVISEFVHIVTDHRRFSKPLSMDLAIDRISAWWNGSNVEQIEIDDLGIIWFCQAMKRYRLGRKRVLDTMLAATFRQSGITSVLTYNGRDFEVFGDFEIVSLI